MRFLIRVSVFSVSTFSICFIPTGARLIRGFQPTISIAKKGMDAPNPFRAKDDNDYWQ